MGRLEGSKAGCESELGHFQTSGVRTEVRFTLNSGRGLTLRKLTLCARNKTRSLCGSWLTCVRCAQLVQYFHRHGGDAAVSHVGPIRSQRTLRHAVGHERTPTDDRRTSRSGCRAHLRPNRNFDSRCMWRVAVHTASEVPDRKEISVDKSGAECLHMRRSIADLNFFRSSKFPGEAYRQYQAPRHAQLGKGVLEQLLRCLGADRLRLP